MESIGDVKGDGREETGAERGGREGVEVGAGAGVAAAGAGAGVAAGASARIGAGAWSWRVRLFPDFDLVKR